MLIVTADVLYAGLLGIVTGLFAGAICYAIYCVAIESTARTASST